MIRRRVTDALVCASALLVTACGMDGPVGRVEGPSRSDGPLTIRPITFATLDYYFRPATVRAEEGWLGVPARRERVWGEMVAEPDVASPMSVGAPDTARIHFVRFPSTSTNPGPPIVYLAGGPGGSGTYSAAGDRFRLFMKLREAGDVIALDQRGTSLAEPSPVCPGSWSYPLDRALEEETLARVVGEHLEACVAALQDSIDLDAFTTRESADDLEALRRALRVERLNLWGISYGTHLGLAYVRAHPDRVGRAVFAGVEGPDHTYKLPSDVDRVFMRVDSAAAAGSRNLAPGDLRRALEEALERLAVHPRVTIEDPAAAESVDVVIGPLDLARAVYFSMGERESIEEVLRRLSRIAEGDDRELALFALRSRRENRERIMALSMDCASAATAVRLRRIEAEAAGALFGDVANLDLRVRCPGWPVTDLGDALRGATVSDVPVLFISGTFDARTPPSNADEILGGFPRGHHLVIVGGSHDDDLFLSSAGIGDAILDFFLTGETGVSRITLSPLRVRGW